MTTSDARAEYAAVRNGVGVIDRRDAGVIDVTGRDRASFLHALLSNEVKALAPGQGCAATLLDVHGKVQVLLLVWVLEDRILLVTPPGLAATTLEALDKYLFSEKVVLEEATEQWALFLAAGPAAPALVQRLTGAPPEARAWSSAAAKLDGIDVRLVRGGGETGEAEVWVAAPRSEADRVLKTLTAAGAVPVGAAALESLRIETGALRFPADIGPAVLLPEVPFADLVSQTKGCYPGQEVVVRIRDRGHVNRHLRGLVLEGEVVPPAGSEILVGDAAIGAVTSATLSLGLGRPLALGMVRRQQAEPGTAVGVRIGERVVPATISDLPFTR
ncbi:MAG TPA: glycine cleavage T C-terminal barrel domain-containing protein [Methylomirabilota bacterium]|nr:glycine cleavage T C-terminal barrel domain-containing protein [Methylomirabilota bacterium]